MGRRRAPAYIPRDATVEEQLKLIADHIYTEAERWIQACIDSEGIRSEFVGRINAAKRMERGSNLPAPLVLRPTQR